MPFLKEKQRNKGEILRIRKYH